MCIDLNIKDAKPPTVTCFKRERKPTIQWHAPNHVIVQKATCEISQLWPIPYYKRVKLFSV